MNKSSSIVLILALILGISIVLFAPFGGGSAPADTESVQNVEVIDGVQYITIEARGGYSPRETQAAAGIPTKLIVQTNGTYDCSAALVIRSIGYQAILPQTGEEEIDLGTPGQETIQGLCSMGMYNFSIEFI